MKKAAAFISAIVLLGTSGAMPFTNCGGNISVVSAAEYEYEITVSMDQSTLVIRPGGYLSVKKLESLGLRFEVDMSYTEDNPIHVNYGQTKHWVYDAKLSDMVFDFPEVTEEGVYTIVATYHNGWDEVKTEFNVYVEISDDASQDPEYNIELKPKGYEYIYENGSYKLWNRTRSVYSKENPVDFVMPVYKDDEEDGRIFVLSSCSVDVFGSENLYIPEGIYEVEEQAFDSTYDLKSVAFSDSVRKIEEQNFNHDVIIRGHSGAYAERFADQYGYAYEYIGDINNDGKCNSADVVGMVSHMYGIKELDEDSAARADENFDAKLDIVDMILLKDEIINPRNSVLGASTADASAVPDIKNVQRTTSSIEADGYMDFASKTASAILLDTEDEKGAENTVYSPLSVYMALSMATECADGNTRDELLKALSAEDIDDLRYENTALFNSLYFDDYLAYCKIANSLWLNNKWKFNQPVLDTIAEKYFGVSFEKDFKNPAVPGEISEWINKNTSGKFTPQIEIPEPEKEIMKIINTVTFKEKWQNEFSDARPDTFYLKDGSELECDFMHMSTDFPTENIGFADNFMKYAVEMNDDYQMNFILPDKGVSIDDIVSDSETMAAIYNDDVEYAKRKIVFSLPKFDVCSKFDLVDAAYKLGIKDAFDAVNGDFSAVIDYDENDIPSAYISDITHEARVTIDEKGCEAAAYTIIDMMAGCPMPPEEEPVYFELNRPFFYYISDTNGTPVFSGIINNPTAE